MHPRWLEFVKKLKTPIMRKGDYTLEVVKKYHKEMGNIGNDLEVIHVAGTNAKGSVTYKLAKMLEYSGYKTGLFISPHLFSWRERVQVNNELISQEYCADFIEKYKWIRDHKADGIELSFFEFFTVLAFQYYKEMKCDACVIEVGLGGRLDATNILPASLLSIITSISLDHVQTLGNTVEEIAKEKAGIIKSGCPVLIGPQVPYDVVSKIAKENGSPLYQSPPGNSDYRSENAELLKLAAKLIGKKFKVTPEAFRRAVEECHLPCRYEHLTEDRLAKHKNLKFVIFDVGHNEDAVLKVMQRMRKEYAKEDIIVVYGCKTRKDYASCLTILHDNSRQIYAVQANHQPESSIVNSSEMSGKEGSIRIENGSIKHTLQHIVERIASGEERPAGIIVIGSFTLMREAREYFGIEDPHDL